MSRNETSPLSQIAGEFLNDEGWPKTSPLAHDKVITWLHSDDIEVLGAAHCLVFDKRHRHRVIPDLSFDECRTFRQRYYERCLCEATEDAWAAWEWADTPFNAAHVAVAWFEELWKDPAVPRKVLVELKAWMARLIKDEACSASLGTAIFDHLWRHKKIRRFFDDWRNDPVLGRLFE